MTETFTDEDGTWLVTLCRPGLVKSCVLIAPSAAFEAKRPPAPEPEPRVAPLTPDEVAELRALIKPVR